MRIIRLLVRGFSANDTHRGSRQRIEEGRTQCGEAYHIREAIGGITMGILVLTFRQLSLYYSLI